MRMILKQIGKWKAVVDRQRGYLNLLSLLMVTYLFIKEAGFSWYYLLVIPVFAVWTWFDAHYIMSREFDYLHRKSPVLLELLKDKGNRVNENQSSE